VILNGKESLEKRGSPNASSGLTWESDLFCRRMAF
jgi:hypothetical protein